MEPGGDLHNGKLQGVYRWQYDCGDQGTEDDTYEACGAHSRELKSVQDCGESEGKSPLCRPRC